MEVFIPEKLLVIQLVKLLCLIPYSPVVTICTTSLTFTFTLPAAHTVYLCVLCGSENKQRLFHCTALTDWLVFITETECIYCAVRSTFYVLPTQCIYVFCVDLRTNSDYFTVQHQRIACLHIIQVNVILNSIPCQCMLNLWQQSGTGSGIPPSTQFSPACCRLFFICTMFALLQPPSSRYVTGPTQSWTNV